jgi:hypothetical protein
MANEKHIFIGIGGQGVKTVAQIKEKVYAKRFPTATESKSRLQAMNDSYRFLFLDTDQRDIDEANKRNRASFENGKVPFISPQTDLINLGRANPHAIYYEAKNDPNNLINKRILEACSPELASKIPDQPLSFGAGAFRIKSRIAFAHALADFQTKLQSAISSLNDVKTVGGGDCIIYYWLVSSSLGGTGSGIFNDVLYHINQIHHQVVGNGDPQLVYTMYMPKVFIDCNATEEKYSLNAFGVFSELEAFKVMSYEPNQNTVMHRLAFNNDYNLVDSNKRYCPFYYLIPIDIQTDKGTSLGSPHVMIRNTAEMLYHLHNGQAGATFRSDIDNYMNDIMERNHKNFLVPMGYVSLQKPNQFFNEYMRTRLRRDVLRSWLLCAEGKESKVPESAIPELVKELFNQLDEGHADSIAQKLIQSPVIVNLDNTLQSQDPESEELDEMLKWGTIEASTSSIEKLFKNEKENAEKREIYKKIILDQIWSQAEVWIREKGLTFAQEAVEQVRNQLIENLKQAEETAKTKRKKIEELIANLPEESNDAAQRSITEKITKTNKVQINKYLGDLKSYIKLLKERELEEWKNDLLRDFCNDEKNDELAKLKKHIASLKDKVAEMNRDAVKEYKKLAAKMGEATMDVTTVYLPQLSTICDGNGWVIDNIFSKLYATFIKAQTDAEETPERQDIAKFIYEQIYHAVNEETKAELAKGQYILQIKGEDPKTGKEKVTDEVRFFCNPIIDRSSEKIVDDFLTILQTVFDKKLRESKDIQEKWETKRVSAFFDDLTNDQKDIVRNSLNPSLFFSYNTSRIEVTKKEEHIVFVAGSEDLAVEMLGFQKGNPKHRYEKADSDDVALVLKSKYGLSLEDYRIYDSIKAVYDRATFREKYHFHHDFAQYLDKLTLSDMPEEVLPQHRTYAKILLLDSFKEEMKYFFYKDKYDAELYTNSMLIIGDCDTEFKIAQPEAFYTDSQTAKLVLKIEDNGRPLFITIDGDNFVLQFAKYCQLYYNYRIGETTETLLQTLLRQKGKNDLGEEISGEQILKKEFRQKREELLQILHDKKKSANLPAERRLYTVLFNIVREEFENVQKFIKK